MQLSPKQRMAIVRLTLCGSHRDAAAAAGVTRVTVWRWMKEDATFQAAFNAWARDQVATTKARVLRMGPQAATAVEKGMARGDARLALRVLENLGFMDRPHVGPTEVQEVERSAKRKDRIRKARERKAEVRIEQEEGNLRMEEMMAPMGGVGLAGMRKRKP
jgi:hypothetical protein